MVALLALAGALATPVTVRATDLAHPRSRLGPSRLKGAAFTGGTAPLTLDVRVAY